MKKKRRRAKRRCCPKCHRLVRVRKSSSLWLHFARPGISISYCEGSGFLIALRKRQRSVERELARYKRPVLPVNVAAFLVSR